MTSQADGQTNQLLGELRIDRSPRTETARQRSPRYLLIAAIAASGLLAFWLWPAARPSASAPAALPAASLPSLPEVIPQATGSALEASGYVVARRTATVSAQITGVVTSVLFEEGDSVKQGQLLARLDSNYAAAALEASSRQLIAAQQLAKQYSVQSEQAARDGRRAVELVNAGLVSQQAAEQAVAKADELAAQLAAQLSNVETARAQRQIAQVNLAYTEIRAPFSGVAISKAAQVGEIISPSASSGYTRTGIATIVDMQSLEVEVEISETHIASISAQMAAQVRLNAYPDLVIPAQVVAIIPTADRGKATVKVRVALMQKHARALPDMGARVSFTSSGTSHPIATSGPASALLSALTSDHNAVAPSGCAVQPARSRAFFGEA